MIAPAIFPEPSWLLTDDVEFAEAERARLLADAHGDAIRALGSTEERIAYLAGVLDACLLDAKGDIG